MLSSKFGLKGGILSQLFRGLFGFGASTGGDGAHGGNAVTVSAYAQEEPVVAQRSFILPLTVSSIGITETKYGITPPHILLTTTMGGIVSIDRRMFDPRRPDREPTEAEKQEGLSQYNPVIPFRHHWLLNYNQPIARVRAVTSSSAGFESTTLITAVGIDAFFARSAPAKTFDQLDPKEINFALLVAALAVLAIIAVVAKKMVASREEKESWK